MTKRVLETADHLNSAVVEFSRYVSAAGRAAIVAGRDCFTAAERERMVELHRKVEARMAELRAAIVDRATLDTAIKAMLRHELGGLTAAAVLHGVGAKLRAAERASDLRQARGRFVN